LKLTSDCGRRDFRTPCLPLLVAILLAAASAPAQIKPLSHRDTKPKAVPDQPGVVKLWVVAIGRPHSLIVDLTQKDFHIYQDGHEQEIIYFSSQPREPLRLGVLLDVSQGRPVEIPDALEWPPISRWLRGLLGKDDRAFVATFNDQVSLLCPWTAKPDELDDALRRAFGKDPDGPSKLYDAIYEVCEERFSSEPGRKALIVLSDSTDFYSGRSQLEALEMAHRTDTILYPVLPWEGTLTAPLFKNVDFAQVFANDTGGFFYFVVKSGDLEKDLNAIGIFLSHVYELAYRPDVSPDGRYHKIKVTCKRPGVKLYTREGYYAPQK